MASKKKQIHNGVEVWVGHSPEMVKYGHEEYQYGIKDIGATRWLELSGFVYNSEDQALKEGVEASKKYKGKQMKRLIDRVEEEFAKLAQGKSKFEIGDHVVVSDSGDKFEGKIVDRRWEEVDSTWKYKVKPDDGGSSFTWSESKIQKMSEDKHEEEKLSQLESDREKYHKMIQLYTQGKTEEAKKIAQELKDSQELDASRKKDVQHVLENKLADKEIVKEMGAEKLTKKIKYKGYEIWDDLGKPSAPFMVVASNGMICGEGERGWMFGTLEEAKKAIDVYAPGNGKQFSRMSDETTEAVAEPVKKTPEAMNENPIEIADAEVMKEMSAAHKFSMDDNQAKAMWETVTAGSEHKMTICLQSMKGKVDDEAAFCNFLAEKAGYEPSR